MKRLRNDPDVLRLDRLRGHAFAPPVELVLPGLYSTERVEPDDKIVVLHYFTGPADWWVVEVDADTTLAFGYCCLGDPAMAEWGYVDLYELATLHIPPSSPPRTITYDDGSTHTLVFPHVVVERDLYWQPQRFADISTIPDRRRAKG